MSSRKDRLRFGRLADHAHLLGQRADEIGHDHRDQRVGHERAQLLLDFARELGRGLVRGDYVLEQRRRDAAVRPHRHLIDNPGLPQTNTRSRSPGPIRYDSVTGVSPASSRSAPACVRCRRSPG